MSRQGRAHGQDRSAAREGRVLPSDHFEFAKVGVPALYADGGVDVIGKPPGWGLAKGDEFTAKDYRSLPTR
jgi:hypothetical protein